MARSCLDGFFYLKIIKAMWMDDLLTSFALQKSKPHAARRLFAHYGEPALTFFLMILLRRVFGGVASGSPLPCLRPSNPRPEIMAFLEMNHLDDELSTASEGLLYAFNRFSDSSRGLASTPSQASLDVSPSWAFKILHTDETNRHVISICSH